MSRMRRTPKKVRPSSVTEVRVEPSPKLLHLTLGPYSSEGRTALTVDYEGEKLAELTSEGAGVVWGVGSLSTMRVERILYKIRGEARFAVHAILRSGTDHHPVLARVEVYPVWSAVLRAHPDLARLAQDGRRVPSPPPPTHLDHRFIHPRVAVAPS